MGKLDSLRALVTGASDGIGLGIVDLFVAEGATVVATSRDFEKLTKANRNKSKVHCVAVDIASRDAPALLRSTVEQKLGGLDILVNNAGVSGPYVPFEQTTDEQWAFTMAVNVDGPFRLTRELIPMLTASGRGRIINIGSVCSLFAIDKMGVYTTSKHAILGMTRALAVELAGRKITANAILPGPIVTGLTRYQFPDPDTDAGKAWLKQLNAMGRYGQPEDIAGAALYFASHHSAYVTGQAITVDGGMTVETGTPGEPGQTPASPSLADSEKGSVD